MTEEKIKQLEIESELMDNQLRDSSQQENLITNSKTSEISQDEFKEALKYTNGKETIELYTSQLRVDELCNLAIQFLNYRGGNTGKDVPDYIK